jgi:hypothetical protein
MKIRPFLAIVGLSLLGVVATCSLQASEALQGPTELLYWDKLIYVYETGALELFNITKDPGERHVLAREQPDKVRELDQRLTGYLLEVNAQMPKLNPNYDATKPTEVKRGGKRKGGP